MKVLIDIGHPAHVHLFKNFACKMQHKGHKILFTLREKEFEKHLLNVYGFEYKTFGKKYYSRAGKIIGLFKFGIQEYLTGLRFKPDILLSHGSMYAAHAAFFLRKPHISFEDTFNFEQIKLYLPFTKIILTSDYKHPNLGKKNIKYSGYHELAYLHPIVFQKNAKVLTNHGFGEIDKFVICRFVAWNASHDRGHKGIRLENKIRLVKEFSKFAKVLISSEDELPGELKKYKLNFPPEEIHHLISEASLVFGESATMITEGAVLGVPGIYLDNTGRLYTKELEENYGLVYNFSESEADQDKAIKKGIELLSNEGIKEEWQKRRMRMLEDKIDVTAFLVWFVEHYPESARIMKENPDYQNRFK